MLMLSPGFPTKRSVFVLPCVSWRETEGKRGAVKKRLAWFFSQNKNRASALVFFPKIKNQTYVVPLHRLLWSCGERLPLSEHRGSSAHREVELALGSEVARLEG